jgi:RimJ/RimL family protein N-acetyltransferase
MSLPPGGVDERSTLAMLRRVNASLRSQGELGSWLIATDAEIVGLCGFKELPKDGVVEIGFGIAASRRRRGHATRAVAALLTEASGNIAIDRLTAQTAICNVGSQRALQRNGFIQVGTRNSVKDGDLIIWARTVR